ncbi:MAG: hypothetical protein JXB32_21315 [Deltaproteobacteria bacterium]|nr:hypothetical protein [Deltaproteobacteria bacterium]
MTNSPRLLLAAIASVPLGTTTCGGCEHLTTQGELGVAQFEWADCDYIFDRSCPIQEAIAAGATTSIRVYNGPELPPYEVRSSDTNVATFTTTDDHVVRVETTRAGDVALELYAVPDATLIDRLPLRIADAASITMTQPAENPPLALMQNGDLELAFRTRQADGSLLVGSGSVTFDSTAGLPITTRGVPGERFERVVVHAAAAGRATLTARTDTATLDVPVAVVTPNEVAEARIAEPLFPLPPPSEGGTDWILASAYLRDGTLVHHPTCSWTSSDPGCIAISDDERSLPDACSVRLDRTRSRCHADITVAVGTFASDTARMEVE